MITKIEYNNWTGTYYVYRVYKHTVLRKDKTKAMKEFMTNHDKVERKQFTQWK